MGWANAACWWRSPEGKIFTEDQVKEMKMSAFQMKAAASFEGELAPAGTHPAAVVGLLDLGTHESEYQGKKTVSRKIYLAWELTGMKSPTGKPYVVGRDYNLTFGKKALLRKLIEGWRGKDFSQDESFDVTKLVGKTCLLTVVHKESNGNIFANIGLVAQPVAGMSVPKPTLTTICWELEGNTPFPKAEWLPFLYGKPLSEWVQASHERSGKAVPSANGSPVTSAPVENLDSDIPF